MKTVNKEDLITITAGDLFTACYDAAIIDSKTTTAGSDHADAHNLADNALALALTKEKGLRANSEPVSNIDLDALSNEIYEIILDGDMEKSIVKAKIVPCMKGSKTFGVSRIKLELEKLLLTKSEDPVECLRDAIQGVEQFGMVRTESGTIITGAIKSEDGVILVSE